MFYNRLYVYARVVDQHTCLVFHNALYTYSIYTLPKNKNSIICATFYTIVRINIPNEHHMLQVHKLSPPPMSTWLGEKIRFTWIPPL